jgi:hypothetical protein
MRTLLFRCATRLSALRDAARNVFAVKPTQSTMASRPQGRSTESGDREDCEEESGRAADFWN